MGGQYQVPYKSFLEKLSALGSWGRHLGHSLLIFMSPNLSGSTSSYYLDQKFSCCTGGSNPVLLNAKRKLGYSPVPPVLPLHRFIAFRGDHLSVLPGVTGGQGVLLGPFSGICLILCWHLIYLITMVCPPPPPHPTPPQQTLSCRALQTEEPKGQPLHSFHPLEPGMGLILLALGRQDSRL